MFVPNSLVLTASHSWSAQVYQTLGSKCSSFGQPLQFFFFIYLLLYAKEHKIMTFEGIIWLSHHIYGFDQDVIVLLLMN